MMILLLLFIIIYYYRGVATTFIFFILAATCFTSYLPLFLYSPPVPDQGPNPSEITGSSTRNTKKNVFELAVWHIFGKRKGPEADRHSY